MNFAGINFSRLLKSEQLNLFGGGPEPKKGKPTPKKEQASKKPTPPQEQFSIHRGAQEVETPEVGERRVINGTAYVFLETTPGLPRWHAEEEIAAKKRQAPAEYNYDLFSQPQKTKLKKPHEMDKEEFESHVFSKDAEGNKTLNGKTLQVERDGKKWNILWDGEQLKTGLSLEELKTIMSDPHKYLGKQAEKTATDEAVTEKAKEASQSGEKRGDGEEGPRLGDRKTVNGHEYVLLETTPGAPRWHRVEDLLKEGMTEEQVAALSTGKPVNPVDIRNTEPYIEDERIERENKEKNSHEHNQEEGQPRDTGRRRPGTGDSDLFGGLQAEAGERAGGEERTGEVHNDEETGDAGRESDAGEPVSEGNGSEGIDYLGSSSERSFTDTERRGRGRNYRITDEDRIGEGGKATKFADNIAALELLYELQTEGRSPTSEEQKVLARYNGWGGLAFAFDARNDKEYGRLLDLVDKGVLTAEEYAAMRSSTVNANYTSPLVISEMWRAVQRLGIEEGRFLEPATGNGLFIGLMPDDVAKNSNFTGTELDSISARIAEYLYPDANINAGQKTGKGFEHVFFPANYYDMAISNVPFGDYKVTDETEPRADFSRAHYSIHNFFFAKSLDKVRPGGLVAFITSRYTLDARDSSFRQMLAEKADLLGAIRLPNTAFKQNAGTEVVTDILFLRKKIPGKESNGENFVGTEMQQFRKPDGKGVEKVAINEYYIAHTENVLGKFSLAGSMYREAELTVEPVEGKELRELLSDAVNRLPEKVIMAPEKVAGFQKPVVVTIEPGLKLGSHYVKDGTIFKTTTEGADVVQAHDSKQRDRIIGMINVRDTLNELLKSEMEGRSDADIEELRRDLNRRYDRFVQKYGYITKQTNKRAFGDDPEYPRIAALEIADPNNKDKVLRADILKQRVYYTSPQAIEPKTPRDALLLNLNLGRGVDMQGIMSTLGLNEEEVATQLKGQIYHDPESEWVTSEDYLSGDVVHKLEAAIAAAKDNPRYNENVEALKAVQPQRVRFADIRVHPGAPWMPSEVMTDFVKYITDTDVATKARYVEALGKWRIDAKGEGYRDRFKLEQSVNNNQVFGTKNMSAIAILEAVMNNADIRLYKDDPLDRDKRILDVEATQLANDRADKIRNEWKKWIASNAERMASLEELYNQRFNRTRLRQWDGSHLTLEGAAKVVDGRPFNLYQHQKNAVWRMIQGGNTLLAHVVGSGKTYTAIAGAMEMKRLGLAQKPMFIVPNHLVPQWAASFYRLYPTANVLAVTKEDFKKENRPYFISKIATGNWDAVIVAHSTFGKIPVHPDTFEEHISKEIAQLRAAREQEAIDAGERAPSTKELEKMIKRLEDRIKQYAQQWEKDKATTFEELGVDQLFVDEAHNFKNLYSPTRLTRLAGVGKSASNRAYDLYIKTRYLFGKRGGQKGVVFATGTPVSNTLSEFFVMQKYLQPNTLDQFGVSNLDGWVNNFGDVSTKLELAPEGHGFRAKTRLSSINNLPELMQLYGQVADIKNVQDLPYIKLPEKLGDKSVAPGSQALQDFVETLVARAKRIRNGEVEPTEDNMLKVTNDGRKAALDMRLVVPSAEDDPHSKVNALVRNLLTEWKETASRKGAQVVFCDLGTPGSDDRFNVYEDIKKKLVKLGIPENEIAFIHDAKTDMQRQQLFDNMNNGNVRILIGSTSKMGEGTNMQKRMTAVHHLDAPWRYSDVTQREARGVRQGNTNDKVKVVTYLTEGSFDAYIWQLLENKLKATALALVNNPSVRSIEEIEGRALTAAEIKAAASGNPLIIEKIQVDEEIRKMDIRHQAYLNEKASAGRKLSYEKTLVPDLRDRIKRAHSDMGKLPEKFAAEINGKKYSEKERMEAAKTIYDASLEMNREAETQGKAPDRKIGSFGGFSLSLHKPLLTGSVHIEFKGEGEYSIPLSENPQGINLQFGALKGRLESIIEDSERRKTEIQKSIEQREKALQAGFEQQGEFDKLLKRKAEIDAALDLNHKENTEGIQDSGDEPDEGEEDGNVVAESKGRYELGKSRGFALQNIFRNLKARRERVH